MTQKKLTEQAKPEDLQLTEANVGGRPLFDGKDEGDVVSKLETAFGIGCNVIQACSFANISRAAFYRYIEDNEAFRDRIESLRQKPLLRAKFTVFKALKNDPNMAMRYIEKFSGEATPDSPIQINFNQAGSGQPIKRKAQANAVKEKLVKIYEEEMYKVMTTPPEVIDGEVVTEPQDDKEEARESNIPVQSTNPHQNDTERKPTPSTGGKNSEAKRVDTGKNPGTDEKKSAPSKGA